MKDLTNLEDDNTILLVILYTLTTIYENMLQKYNAVDITTIEARNLKVIMWKF